MENDRKVDGKFPLNNTKKKKKKVAFTKNGHLTNNNFNNVNFLFLSLCVFL